MKKKDEILSWLMIIAGAVIAAFALEEFLAPNNIFDGGVTGISMIITHVLNEKAGVPIKLGILVMVINLPFIIYGFKKIGKQFIIKCAVALIIFSVMTAVFEPLQNATEDNILAVTFGGVFLGIGVGLVLRGGGILDGTEIVALVLSKKISISVGTLILLFNVIIYSVAGAVFGLDRGMYSLLMYFITSKVIDIVEMGWDNTKSVMIITNDGNELAHKIYEGLGRTVTFLKGEGLVSKDTKDILYCVVTRAEIHDLKLLINSVEGSTFTTISDVSEIVGNHMKSREKKI
ncbi:MAG: YitT family protein [Lachnospiraceae bacterium]|nr:YitT family protein [Lachnospiraceae bacterium]